ncbi:TPA: hypothetical protein ACNABL_004796 [Escherichia coli]
MFVLKEFLVKKIKAVVGDIPYYAAIDLQIHPSQKWEGNVGVFVAYRPYRCVVEPMHVYGLFLGDEATEEEITKLKKAVTTLANTLQIPASFVDESEEGGKRRQFDDVPPHCTYVISPFKKGTDGWE